MPQFAPGETKKAIVEMTNPTGSPFDYSTTLYLGVNMVAMASATFHLEGSETKNVEISPVVMPTDEGTYPVYLDVWSNSTLLGHYQAVEDVSIVGISHFVYTNLSCWEWSAGFKILKFRCRITNTGTSRESHVITIYKYRSDLGEGTALPERYEVTVTLDPGQSIEYAYPGMHAGAYRYTWCFFAVDDGGGKSATCCVYVGE